jgi:hypothetical protein
MHKLPHLPACVTQLPLKKHVILKALPFSQSWYVLVNSLKIKREVKLCLLENVKVLDKLFGEMNIAVVERHYGINQSTNLMRYSLF